MAFGTLFTLDSVAQTTTTIGEVGEEKIWKNLDGYFAAHNLLFNQALALVAERTTERLRRYGGTADVIAQELGEFGQPSAQKLSPTGYNIGFPLRRYGYALQWTRFAFENMSAEEFSKQVNGVTDADEQRLYSAIRTALFKPTNSVFTDWQQTPTIDLTVKALLNADGEVVPTGPSAVSFNGATHTHYSGVTAANAPTAAEVNALIENVVEHYNTGNVAVYINRGSEAAFRAFAGFSAYIDARLLNQTTGLVATGALDVRNLYDRAIGILNGAEVFVKPWVPVGYAVCVGLGADAPLVVRQPVPQTARDLRLVAQDENHPLRATEWEHRYGVAVWNRSSAAVLDTVTGGGVYAQPAGL